MKNYIYLETNKKFGTAGVSKNVILHICEHSLKRIKEKHQIDLVNDNDNDKFSLIIRDNTAYIKFQTKLSEDIDSEIFKTELENVLSSNLLSLCEGIKFKLNIEIIK